MALRADAAYLWDISTVVLLRARAARPMSYVYGSDERQAGTNCWKQCMTGNRNFPSLAIKRVEEVPIQRGAAGSLAG